MRRISCTLALLFSIFPLLFQSAAIAQTPPVSDSPHRETTQDLIAKLNQQQKLQFDNAEKAFSEHRYSDSLGLYQLLLKDFPDDPILIKFASDAALNNGDAAFALKAIKPLAQADPDDWQAAAMLTRACAETGDIACRDAGIAHMLDLHKRGITPPNFQQYVVESVKVYDNTLLIRTLLVPIGYYKVYAIGRVTDSAGKLIMTITLESNDLDQPAFAHEHPDEAAKGMRAFTLNAYLETGLNDNGQRTQTHYIYKFFDGQPSYATVRDELLKVANGTTSSPIGSTIGLIVP
jgi:hypothetical protein